MTHTATHLVWYNHVQLLVGVVIFFGSSVSHCCYLLTPHMYTFYCLHWQSHTLTHVHTQTHIHIQINTHIHNTQRHKHRHACMHTHAHVHTDTHRQTDTHTPWSAVARSMDCIIKHKWCEIWEGHSWATSPSINKCLIREFSLHLDPSKDNTQWLHHKMHSVQTRWLLQNNIGQVVLTAFDQRKCPFVDLLCSSCLVARILTSDDLCYEDNMWKIWMYVCMYVQVYAYI